MRTLLLLSVIILTSLQAAELPFKPPAAYACDVSISDSSGKKQTCRMVFGGADKQRMEMKSEKGDMVMIIRKDMKQQHMLMPQSKMAMTMPYDPNQVKVKDPTQDPNSQWKKTGNEKVNDVNCDRYEWSSGADSGIAWIDSARSVMVRAVGKDKGQADFTNYQIGEQKADLFEVPKDYQPMGFGGMMPPSGPPHH